MLTLQEILNLKSNVLKESKVKLIRHADARAEYRDLLKNRESLLEYQRQQGKDVFNCDFIVSFNVVKGRTVLFGVFEVKGRKMFKIKTTAFIMT
jgi:hypothetical protein